MSGVSVRVVGAFEALDCDALRWRELLAAGDTVSVFLSLEWLMAWWQTFGRGRLMLVVAEHRGRPVAVAPLFAEAGMVFFVGSGGADYLDFVGDIGDPAVLCGLLSAARDRTPDFVGFRFYHVPDASRTGRRLQAAAQQLALACYGEEEIWAPALDLKSRPEAGVAAVQKKSLVRHQRFFEREGDLRVRHLRDGDSITEHLEPFFQQHVERWAGTPFPSLFNDPLQRLFYTRLTRIAGHAGWLRFMRLDWEDRPIAFHYGYCFEGTFLWYKPSFDVALARRSPGEVLLRQLLLAAQDEGAAVFDFGLGDEPFKRRFATRAARVRNWGLYPP